jgi:hypothetical protein
VGWAHSRNYREVGSACWLNKCQSENLQQTNGQKRWTYSFQGWHKEGREHRRQYLHRVAVWRHGRKPNVSRQGRRQRKDQKPAPEVNVASTILPSWESDDEKDNDAAPKKLLSKLAESIHVSDKITLPASSSCPQLAHPQERQRLKEPWGTPKNPFASHPALLQNISRFLSHYRSDLLTRFNSYFCLKYAVLESNKQQHQQLTRWLSAATRFISFAIEVRTSAQYHNC